MNRLTMNKYAIARWAVYASAGFNVGLTLGDLWRGEYATAALQSVLIVALMAWLAIAPKLDAWLAARLEEATAQRDTAKIVFDEVQRMQRAGELRFGVTASMSSPARTH